MSGDPNNPLRDHQPQASAALGEVWFIVLLLMATQYALQSLVYFGYLGELFKSNAYLLTGALALFLSFHFGGRPAVQSMLAAYFRLPRNVGWIFFAILWNFPLIMASLPLNDILQASEPEFMRPHGIRISKILENVALFCAIAICDELFWIGFVFPRLISSTYSGLKASLAIGTFWGLSYTPLVFTEFLVSYGLTPASVTLGWFAVAPIYIWLYASTSSALLVVLMSVSLQFSYWTLPILPQAPLFDNGDISMLNLLTLFAGIALWKLFPPKSPLSASHTARSAAHAQPLGKNAVGSVR